MVKLGVHIDGIRPLRAKMKTDTLLADSWRSFLEDAGQEVKQEVEKAAPESVSGRLRRGIKLKVSGAAVARAATVSALATRKGFRYSYALDAGARYHHRGSRKPTRGWFRDVRDTVQPRINRRLSKLAAAVERAFGR